MRHLAIIALRLSLGISAVTVGATGQSPLVDRLVTGRVAMSRVASCALRTSCGGIGRCSPETASMGEAEVLLCRREEVVAVTAADGSGKIIGVLTRLDHPRSRFTLIRRNDPGRSTSLSGSVTTRAGIVSRVASNQSKLAALDRDDHRINVRFHRVFPRRRGSAHSCGLG
jgi:hypothetical protein